MCGRYSLTKFANFLIIVLPAGIVTIYEPKVVKNYAHNTIIRKFANHTLQHFQPNFRILRLLKGSSTKECRPFWSGFV